MAPNFYTFNRFNGLAVGVTLIRDGVNPRTMRPLPPHIMCGGSFIAAEQHWTSAPALLYEASLHEIKPASGARPFEVLVPRHRQGTKHYVFVDSRSPRGMKQKVTGDEINARSGVEKTSGVRLVLGDRLTGSYLLEFGEAGDQVDLWHADGSISRLVLQDGAVQQVPLTLVEMAKLRIAQFEDQIAELNFETEIPRYHGIIAGATRLLRHAPTRAVEDILVDFLSDQVGEPITDRLRADIRSILLASGHPFAGTFAPAMYAGNVVRFAPKEGAGEAKAAALARKRQRAEEERARRLALRGASGGGNDHRSGQKGQKKKGK